MGVNKVTKWQMPLCCAESLFSETGTLKCLLETSIFRSLAVTSPATRPLLQAAHKRVVGK